MELTGDVDGKPLLDRAGVKAAEEAMRAAVFIEKLLGAMVLSARGEVFVPYERLGAASTGSVTMHESEDGIVLRWSRTP